MTKSNALYFLRHATVAVADELQEANDGIYAMEYDPTAGSVDFVVEGESRYRIEVKVFELGRGE